MKKSLWALCGFFALTYCLSGEDWTDALSGEFSLEEDTILKNPEEKNIPAGTRILEAENLDYTPGSWIVTEQIKAFNRFNGAASDGKLLAGASAGQGCVSGVFPIPEKKTYRLWVRYIDDNKKEAREGAPFLVRVFQNKKQIAEKTFDEKHIPRRHDRWFRHDFQWDVMEVPASRGEISFTLEKKEAGKEAGPHGRSIDCFVLTPDRAYLPHVFDFHSVFVRGQALPEQSGSIKLQVAGLTLEKDVKDRRRNLFSAGETSRWTYLSETLKTKAEQHRFGAGCPINPYARGDERPHFFKIQFSTVPDESGVFAEILHKEPGLQRYFTLDPASRHFESDIDWSAESLNLSVLHSAPNGKYPMKFPFGGTLALSEEMWSTRAIENEIKAQHNLGINEIPPPLWKSPLLRSGFVKHYSECEFLFHVTKGCICTPDTETMKKVMKKKIDFMKKSGSLEFCRSMGVMDEPAFGVSHVMECAQKNGKCAQKFVEYLKDRKVSAKELGLVDLSEARLTRKTEDGARFYWSVRYRNHVLTEFFRTCTEIVGKYAPGVRTRVNIATELVSNGNMVQYGVDWFEVFNTGALTLGETEDWSNLMPTYQVAGYITDVLRGACRKNNVPFEILNILAGRSAWEIQAKGFSEIGRGAKGMGFFRYGPVYSGASDSASHIPSVHEAIKNITYPTGAVEDILLSGTVARGDAAMLLSVTGDIWQILTFSNPFGRERMWLHLLLTHLGIRLDILGEEDLTDELSRYRHLFVTDANIRRAYLPPLLRWIENGGTLIMTPGSLTSDEYNAPLGFDEAVGLTRKPVVIHTGQNNPTDRTGNTELSGVRIREFQKTGNGKPFQSVSRDTPPGAILSFGKGKIAVCGFLPGLSYIQAQKKNPSARFHSDRLYSADERRRMAQVLKIAALTPAVHTDNFLVEAILLESPSADLVTLSNWSGTPQTLTLTLPDRGYQTVRLTAGKILSKESDNGILSIHAEIGAGDYVVLQKE